MAAASENSDLALGFEWLLALALTTMRPLAAAASAAAPDAAAAAAAPDAAAAAAAAPDTADCAVAFAFAGIEVARDAVRRRMNVLRSPTRSKGAAVQIAWKKKTTKKQSSQQMTQSAETHFQTHSRLFRARAGFHAQHSFFATLDQWTRLMVVMMSTVLLQTTMRMRISMATTAVETAPLSVSNNDASTFRRSPLHSFVQGSCL